MRPYSTLLGHQEPECTSGLTQEERDNACKLTHDPVLNSESLRLLSWVNSLMHSASCQVYPQSFSVMLFRLLFIHILIYLLIWTYIIYYLFTYLLIYSTRVWRSLCQSKMFLFREKLMLKQRTSNIWKIFWNPLWRIYPFYLHYSVSHFLFSFPFKTKLGTFSHMRIKSHPSPALRPTAV